jgi:peptidoglycan/xylan/chitin deacetylase (PgdA/CDA1 family)
LEAGPTLARYEARATYYVAMGLLETKTELGPQFTTADLEHLLEEGHELGCHTFEHVDVSSISITRLRDSVRENAASLERLLPAAKLPTFTYPLGQVSLAAKRVLSPGFA